MLIAIMHLIIDADDTLWENNIYFERAFDDFCAFLSHSALNSAQIRDVLNEIELVNAKVHGYGSKNFGRNLQQAYHHLCERDICPHDLEHVMAFYDFRDVQPEKIYPKGADGKPRKFDDTPEAYLANMDVVDPPFDRKLGQAPAMTEQDMRDIIAFLGTLTDGYRPQGTLAVH